MKKLQQMKNDNKGFTLIEIVIVIVIIAILAAMLVPSLLSWIDSAKQKSAISAASSIKTSIESVIADDYANGTAVPTTNTSFGNWASVQNLVGGKTTASGLSASTTFTVTSKTITAMTYNDGGITATYSDGKWTAA